MPPDAAARARARVHELESTRRLLDERLRERFPGYSELVHAPLPTVAEVSQRLAQDEALVMLLSGEADLYVWVVAAEELPPFKRVAITASALRGLVARVRTSLEFSGPRGRPPA